MPERTSSSEVFPYIFLRKYFLGEAFVTDGFSLEETCYSG
jgi:hypothetical protein